MTESAGSKRLRVLFLSQRFLYPFDTGGKIRTGKLLEKLSEIFDVTLISNLESPKDDVYVKNISRLCTNFHAVPWKEVKKYTFRFYLRLLVRQLSRYPITVLNDHSKRLEETVLTVLAQGKYDLVICDFAQSGLNFRRVRGYPSLLFQHNVESMIPYRHFRASRDPVSRIFWWLQWFKMRRYEQQLCQNFDAIVTVSEADKCILEKEFCARNVYAIPTGVDTEYFSSSETSIQENSAVFVGAMDWLPNEDGVLFFVREIFARIKNQVNSFKFTVVGRNPSPALLRELRKYPEITVTGWVEDVRPYLATHALCVIPLRIGGGTRIKVYEAMSMGKGIVSTVVGTEGLPVVDGENVVLADEAEDFADAVVRLLRDRSERDRIGSAARTFVEGNCSWRKVAETFGGICMAAVQKRQTTIGITT
jgi:glycosyltransferase involved in cell wall biosynthesis